MALFLWYSISIGSFTPVMGCSKSKCCLVVCFLGGVSHGNMPLGLSVYKTMIDAKCASVIGCCLVILM